MQTQRGTLLGFSEHRVISSKLQHTSKSSKEKNTHRIGIIEWHNVHQLGRGVVSWNRGNHILGPRISIKFLLLAKCLDQGCGPVRAVRLSERHLAVLIGTCIVATTARPIAEVSHPRCRTMTQSISLGHPAAGKILIKRETLYYIFSTTMTFLASSFFPIFQSQRRQ